MAKFTKTVTVNCPYCQNDRVIKNGRGRDSEQRYLCRNCSKRFTDKGATAGRSYSPNVIGAAVRAFYSGVSYKQIAEGLEEQYDVPEPSKATIYRWVSEYTDHAVKSTKDYKAHTGSEWVADEMVVTVGGQKYWLWNVMDSETRYILAAYLSKRRDARAARSLFRRAQANAANIPKTIKTDRLRSYISAIEDLYGSDVKHVQSDGITAEVNNNLSERLQGTFRSRTKTLRGLDSRESGQAYLDGWVLTYNHFRDHESLRGRTPAEKARVGSPFTSWEDVVESSARRRLDVRTDLLAPPEPEGKARRSRRIPSASTSLRLHPRDANPVRELVTGKPP